MVSRGILMLDLSSDTGAKYRIEKYTDMPLASEGLGYSVSPSLLTVVGCVVKIVCRGRLLKNVVLCGIRCMKTRVVVDLFPFPLIIFRTISTV